MRQAGFEPAHPEIVGLKSTALDHSAIDAKTFKKIYCSLRGLNPRPRAHKTRALTN
jgi:hypothetical protein